MDHFVEGQLRVPLHDTDWADSEVPNSLLPQEP